MKKRKEIKPVKKPEGVILLKDLAPRKNIKGGAGKIVFGEQVVKSEDNDTSASEPRSRKEHE